MRRRYVLVTVLAASLAAIATSHDPAPRLVWNATASAPVGLYHVSPGATPAVGDMVLAKPDPALGRWLASRHYVPLGVPLIKPVAARAGQRLCRYGTHILLDGRMVAIARTADRAERPLPVWAGCRAIGPHEILLLNAQVADSLDGRYFGPVREQQIIGTVHPLLTRAQPDAAFVWHGWRP